MPKFRSLLYLIAVSTCFISCESNHLLKEVKLLDYPSASAIEYFDGKLYVMGDDANHMLVLDSGLNIIDSIPFFNYSSKRIPKSVKPDLEAMTMAWQPGNSRLLLVGSGSLAPYRNIAFLVDPAAKKLIRYDLILSTDNYTSSD
jgi:hypothetical protein